MPEPDPDEYVGRHRAPEEPQPDSDPLLGLIALRGALDEARERGEL